MSDPNREAIRDLIARIEARDRSIYFIAKRMGLQVVQVQRMKKSGRCQPHERDQLQAILDEVSRETLHPVTITAG